MSVNWDELRAASESRIRRFRRASGDGLPFFAYGFLPLLGLFILTLVGWNSFARHSVEQVARSSAEKVVAEAGADWASINVSGQWVTVGGVPPTPEAGERLINSIRIARAPTWLGLARPATRVTGNFGTAQRPGGPSAPVSAGSAEAPEYNFRISSSRLTLDGRVPDIATRDAIITAANASLPSRIEEVENNLEPMGVATPDGFRATALRGIETIKLCDAGSASFTNLKFDVTCELPVSGAERARALASAPLTYGSVGEIQILAKEAIESCDQQLSRLLDASRIEFEPGSDLIASSKAALLDLTARAAADCPGTLRVEGHTDNTGSRPVNEDLSRRRAEAVRAALIQRGVEPSRLIAVGYGPARPIGDNGTESGRALNRRIEIRIVRPDE